MNQWLRRKRAERARRALERQADYQRKKADHMLGHEAWLSQTQFVAVQQLRTRLERVRPFEPQDRILEVGSGSHGLVFWLGSEHAVGVDPLAVEYKSLFPKWQGGAATVAAMGEHLPFDEASFDVVLSDNVIDHAEAPLEIIDEIVRVLKPGGLMYFTVNVHHPIYELASRAHGWWNAAGLKVELSAFADHTVHFTEDAIRNEFKRPELQIIEQSSDVDEIRRKQRSAIRFHPDSVLKAAFFKNANYEVIAFRR
jgi:SAM-dependent methyltransferase